MIHARRWKPSAAQRAEMWSCWKTGQSLHEIRIAPAARRRSPRYLPGHCKPVLPRSVEPAQRVGGWRSLFTKDDYLSGALAASRFHVSCWLLKLTVDPAFLSAKVDVIGWTKGERRTTK